MSSKSVEPLDSAYEMLLASVEELWDWHYRTRLAELRRNTKVNQWIDGIHVPSKLAGEILGFCRVQPELRAIQPFPWDVKKIAEAEAYSVFVEEVRNDKVAPGRPKSKKD